MLTTVVDLVVMAGATYLSYFVLNAVGGSTARQWAASIAAGLIITFGYPTATETIARGRTLGSLLLGLRVVRDDGGAIRFRQALLRGLAFWMLDFAVWTGFCGGLVCAAVNGESKRLGDLMAGTIVIRTRSPRPPPLLPPVPAELRAWAAQLELSRLPDNLVTAARVFVQRYDRLLSHPRQQLAVDLAQQVAARTAPPPPSELQPRDFLAAVVAERRQRPRPPSPGAQHVPTAAELPQGWR